MSCTRVLWSESVAKKLSAGQLSCQRCLETNLAVSLFPSLRRDDGRRSQTQPDTVKVKRMTRAFRFCPILPNDAQPGEAKSRGLGSPAVGPSVLCRFVNWLVFYFLGHWHYIEILRECYIHLRCSAGAGRLNPERDHTRFEPVSVATQFYTRTLHFPRSRGHALRETTSSVNLRTSGGNITQLQ